MALSKTSRLQAVNTMLSTIGEAPVNTLTGTVAVDVATAERVLDETSLEVQSMGWHFNTVPKVTLSPDSTTKLITVATNVVRIDLESSSTYDLVLRGDTLFDRKNNTNLFDDDIKNVTLVTALDFTELPQLARQYITIRAARVFQDRVVGSEKHHAFTLRDEMMALSKLKEYESDTADYSIFSNFTVARALRTEPPINEIE
jgi:hypothetical protein